MSFEFGKLRCDVICEYAFPNDLFVIVAYRELIAMIIFVNLFGLRSDRFVRGVWDRVEPRLQAAICVESYYLFLLISMCLYTTVEGKALTATVLTSGSRFSGRVSVTWRWLM